MIITGVTEPFRKYCEIPRLAKRPEVLDTDYVYVTEKINGSNFRIKVTEDGLLLGSHDITYDPSTNNNFSKYMPIFNDMKELIITCVFMEFIKQGKEVVIYGEVFGGHSMKGTSYKDAADFRVFDISIDDNYIPFDIVVPLCNILELKTVPLLYKGKPDLELFKNLIGKSVLTTEENTGEGIVIKHYGKRAKNGAPLFAKMVAERFEEVKREPKVFTTEMLITRDKCKLFAETFVTTPRVYKLIEKAKELGKYTGELCDMKFFIPMLWEDLRKEESDYINDLIEKEGLTERNLNKSCTNVLRNILTNL